jgi:hypothetical protein
MFTQCESQTLKPRNQVNFSSNFESISNANKFRKEDLFSSTKSIQIGGIPRSEAGDFGSTIGSNFIPCFQEVASREVSAIKKHFYDSSELKDSKLSDCLTVESKRKKLLGNIPELKELVSGANLNRRDNKENIPERNQNRIGTKTSGVGASSNRLKANSKNGFLKNSLTRKDLFFERRESVEKASTTNFDEKKEIKPSKNSEFGFKPSYFTPMEQEELDLKLEELRSSKRKSSKSVPPRGSRAIRENEVNDGKTCREYSNNEEICTAIPTLKGKNLKIKFKRGELYNKIDNLLLEIKKQNK